MKKDFGFTLIETLIVLLLLLSIATLGGGMWDRLRSNQILRSTGRALVAELSQARSQAVTRNLSIAVRIRADRQAYSLSPAAESPGRWRRLPDGIRFQNIPKQAIVFFSRGNAAPGGTAVLSNGQDELKIVVAVSGRIRWEWIRP